MIFEKWSSLGLCTDYRMKKPKTIIASVHGGNLSCNNPPMLAQFVLECHRDKISKDGFRDKYPLFYRRKEDDQEAL
jgi:hypothetical protein